MEHEECSLRWCAPMLSHVVSSHVLRLEPTSLRLLFIFSLSSLCLLFVFSLSSLRLLFVSSSSPLRFLFFSSSPPRLSSSLFVFCEGCGCEPSEKIISDFSRSISFHSFLFAVVIHHTRVLLPSLHQPHQVIKCTVALR